jgi:hypothetical protein
VQDAVARLTADVEIHQQVIQNLRFDDPVQQLEEVEQLATERERAKAVLQANAEYMADLALEAVQAAAHAQNPAALLQMVETLQRIGVSNSILRPLVEAVGLHEANPAAQARMMSIHGPVAQFAGLLLGAMRVAESQSDREMYLRAALLLAQQAAPGPWRLLLSELEWAGGIVVDRWRWWVTNPRAVKRLTELTEAQLQHLEVRSRLLKRDVDELKRMRERSRRLSAECDSTKLARRDPDKGQGGAGVSVGKALALTGLIVGVGAAGGYALSKALEPQQDCSDEEANLQNVPGFSATAAERQRFITALANYCSCLGYSAGTSLGGGLVCP